MSVLPRFVAFIFLYLLYVAYYSFGQSFPPNCNNRKGLFYLYPGQKLTLPKGKMKNTKFVANDMECAFACMEVHWCRSVNFKIDPLANGLHACQLISEQFAGKQYVDQNKAYNHYILKSPCQENPCRNGGKCTLQCNRQRYYCHCNEGFGGEHCEKVDGNWSPWRPWGACSVKCGGGSQSRSRTCSNPAPAHGGKNCQGNSLETRNCSEAACKAKNCVEVLQNGYKQSGEYYVYPDSQRSFKVYCDQKTSGGGWIVFQRRKDGSVDFYRAWADYKNGFGDLKGEFWLGLDKIHRLTQAKRNFLRVDLEDFQGSRAYAEYDYFAVSNEQSKYSLSLGNYSGGTAGDSLSYHRNMNFTTRDNDNDPPYTGGNCAIAFTGAWWYNNCHHTNLNGQYYCAPETKQGKCVSWKKWKNKYVSLKGSEMKIKPAV